MHCLSLLSCLAQAVELERQSFDAKSAVVVKDTEVQRLRDELEAASQVRLSVASIASRTSRLAALPDI